MNAAAQKIILFCTTLAIIGGTAGALEHLKGNRRLGEPGIKAVAIPGQVNVEIAFPANVLDFTSTNVPTSQVVLDYLPKDTSYASRLYTAPDGFQVMANLILMGADRTSIHRPDYCLPGQGWQIAEKISVKIPIAGASAYELPVQEWVVHNNFTAPDGRSQAVSGVYVFWFVAGNDETDDYTSNQTSIFYHLFRHGELQRWAYASYFTLCPPGQEDAVFARVKNLIAASVPEFQIAPRTGK